MGTPVASFPVDFGNTASKEFLATTTEDDQGNPLAVPAPYNLTGCSAQVVVRVSFDITTDPLFTLTSAGNGGIVIDELGGKITVTIPDTLTGLMTVDTSAASSTDLSAYAFPTTQDGTVFPTQDYYGKLEVTFPNGRSYCFAYIVFTVTAV